MDIFFQNVVNGWLNSLPWMLLFAVGFAVLARLWPCNPKQPLIHKGLLTDIVYFFINPFFSRVGTILFFSAAIGLFFYDLSPETLQSYFTNGHGPLSELPLWLQAALIFVLADILLYWIHRMFHTGQLWNFHAIHHSPVHVDWTTSYRFHPLNIILGSTFVNCLMVIVGFSPAAITLMDTLNLLYSVMVHANLNWTFGPLKYVFASPVFHRWHHTAQEEGMDKNFAPTFPLLDIMFGTFYMPEHLPERYGVDGANIPESYVGQLIYPLKKNS